MSKRRELQWVERRAVVTPSRRITVDVWMDYDRVNQQAVKALESKTQRSRDGALIVEVVSWEERKD